MRTVDLRLLAAFLLALAQAAPAVASDDENAARLREMPLGQRQRLVGALEEFGRLPSAEQASVREVDRKLQSLPAADRANYYAAMRRYHLWLNALPETRRNEVLGLPPADRMKAVSRIVKEQQARPSTAPPFFQMADTVGVPLFDLANRIKVWLALPKAQKDELERIAEPAARQRRLAELAKTLKVTPVVRPHLNPDDELIGRYAKKRLFPELQKTEDFTKAARKQRLAEHAYFLEHPPAKVKPENLTRFTAALPSWFRSTYDPLPPDEARRRLTILYRIVFPPDSEFLEPKPAPPVSTPRPEKSSPPPKPAAGKGQDGPGSAPF